MENFSTLNSIQTSKKKKMKNKRRFSDDQIRSLESIFENESKLEPRKKLQLARELGLHPRQVAIWFQNKRARFKSKQLEREYNVLLANYNALASGFESLKKEKQGLIVQLQKLNDLVNKVQAETQCCNTNAAANSSDSQSENDKSEENNHNYNKNNNTKECECEARPLGTLEGTEYGVGILSDDGCSENTSYLGMNGETDLLTMVEPGGSSLTSPGDWCNLRSDDLFNQSANSYEWWDFWS